MASSDELTCPVPNILVKTCSTFHCWECLKTGKCTYVFAPARCTMYGWWPRRVPASTSMQSSWFSYLAKSCLWDKHMTLNWSVASCVVLLLANFALRTKPWHFNMCMITPVYTLHTGHGYNWWTICVCTMLWALSLAWGLDSSAMKHMCSLFLCFSCTNGKITQIFSQRETQLLTEMAQECHERAKAQAMCESYLQLLTETELASACVLQQSKVVWLRNWKEKRTIRELQRRRKMGRGKEMGGDIERQIDRQTYKEREKEREQGEREREQGGRERDEQEESQKDSAGGRGGAR